MINTKWTESIRLTYIGYDKMKSRTRLRMNMVYKTKHQMTEMCSSHSEYDLCGNVEAIDLGLTSLTQYSLPKRVTGSVFVSSNKLTSLEGAPYEIDGSLYVSNNQLITLENSPEIVSDNFDVHCNLIETLDGIGTINGNVRLDDNRVVSLRGLKTARGCINLTKNQLTSLEGGPSEYLQSLHIACNRITNFHDIHRYISKIGSMLYFDTEVASSILGLLLIDVGSFSVYRRFSSGPFSSRFNGASSYRTADSFEHDSIALKLQSILNKWKNQGRRGVMGATRELLDSGLDEYARI